VLLPASAVTFARSSLNLNGSSSTNSSAPNITAQQARDAIVAARQMLTTLEQQHDDHRRQSTVSLRAPAERQTVRSSSQW
jgi:hypothetical protein